MPRMRKQDIDQGKARVAKVCARGGYMQWMNKAWEMHMWGKVCKIQTTDQNMLNMSKHGKPQNLVPIRIQKNEKNTIETFYQTPSIHTMNN